MGKIIAVANQKGGVGKTTTAINLAAGLSYFNQKVLLVDFDPQGNTTQGVGTPRENIKFSIYNVLMGNHSINDAKLKLTHPPLTLVPATIDLAGADLEMAEYKVGRERLLKNKLDVIKAEYDYIIIDCPPSLGLLTLNALTAASSVLVPIQCEFYALEGVSQLMNTISLVQRNLNPALTLEGVLMTMFDARTNLSIQVVDEVKKHFRNKVYQTIIPRNVRLSEAPSHGQPVIIYDPKSKGAEVYLELAKEVIGDE